MKKLTYEEIVGNDIKIPERLLTGEVANISLLARVLYAVIKHEAIGSSLDDDGGSYNGYITTRTNAYDLAANLLVKEDDVLGAIKELVSADLITCFPMKEGDYRICPHSLVGRSFDEEK